MNAIKYILPIVLIIALEAMWYIAFFISGYRGTCDQIGESSLKFFQVSSCGVGGFIPQSFQLGVYGVVAVLIIVAFVWLKSRK